MGKGTFIGNSLDLYVSVDGVVSDPAALETTLQSFANRFYEATDGQLHIKNIRWVDGGEGLMVADVWLREGAGDGVAGIANPNGLGVLGAKCELYQFTTQPFDRDRLAHLFVHELGHYLWNLGDEYKGETLVGTIDVDRQIEWDAQAGNPVKVFLTPDFPLVNPVTGENYDLSGCEVTLYFADGASSATALYAEYIVGGGIALVFEVAQPFPGHQPHEAVGETAYVRPFGVCGPFGQDHCVMNGRGGQPSLLEFCGDLNHDPARVTIQSQRYAGASCWATIAARMDEADVAIAVPGEGQPTGEPPEDEAVSIAPLVKETRLVVVVDRSGSMAESGKAEGAKAAAAAWLGSFRAQVEFFQEAGQFGVVVYDHEIDTPLPLQPVSGIDVDLATTEMHELLEPRGATNIRDALEAAADMLADAENASGRAVHQAVALVSDGVHNTPPPAAIALDVVQRFKELGIPIFTLGLGTAENVNATILEELARQTGGTAYMAAIDADPAGLPGMVSLRIADLVKEIRGELAAEVSLGFEELPAGLPLTTKLEEWAGLGSRPELDEILHAAGVESASGLMQLEPGRVRQVGFVVEDGAKRAEAIVFYPEKHELWVYLVDPSGVPVPCDQLKPIRGRGPFDGVMVKSPKPGRWTAVMIRVPHGPRFRAFFGAGVENRDLVVTGGCDHVVPLGSPVRLWARATFAHDLSGLVVRARLRGPQGAIHNVVLADARADEPFSGLYEGYAVPTIAGHYSGQITVSCKGPARIANGLDRLLHTPVKPPMGASLDLSAAVSPFTRVLSVYCDVGTRPVPKDRDRELGLVGKFPRPKRPGRPESGKM